MMTAHAASLRSSARPDGARTRRGGCGLTKPASRAACLHAVLHGSTVAMCHPRRLCPFAVKKRIEAVQNSTHPSGSVRRPVPQEIGERPFPSE
jgi:hypothetical protein